jgi:hypothetical protein
VRFAKRARERAQSRNETIHFHELIHVVQWRTLGPEQFLFIYANGLERFGYLNSPLEVMAFDAEAMCFVREPISTPKSGASNKMSDRCILATSSGDRQILGWTDLNRRLPTY